MVNPARSFVESSAAAWGARRDRRLERKAAAAVNVAAVYGAVIEEALQLFFADFEDAITAAAARRAIYPNPQHRPPGTDHRPPSPAAAEVTPRSIRRRRRLS